MADKMEIFHNYLISGHLFPGMIHALTWLNLRHPEAQPVKWMEIIKLRVAVDQLDRIGPQLELLLDEIREVPGLDKITAYVGVSSPGDVGLTLLWNTEAVPPPFGSPLTQSLVPACKKFGLVDHSVWIESEGDGRDLKSVNPTNPRGDRSP
jgi:hypothetical protein